MPKPRKSHKRFIDPKTESTFTFNLVHRSQKDPLAADSDAPQHVLQLTRQSKPDAAEAEAVKKRRTQKEKDEHREFGVFYDDNYDYMQHLKDRKKIEHDWGKAEEFLGKANVRKEEKKDKEEKEMFQDAEESSEEEEENFLLPSVAFATKGKEEEVGLLNKAAPRAGPRLDWDPEIVETLDDEFKHEQVFTLKDEGDDAEDGNLEDFMGQGEEGDYDSEEGDYDSEADDRVPSMDGDHAFSDEETKTKFTEYSMSSSVMPRSEHLQTLDDRFEKFFDNYEDENTGALDMDEIEGIKSEKSDVMKQVLTEFKRHTETERVKPDWEKIVGRIQEEEEDENGKLVERDLMQLPAAVDKWDAESILSTYSNIHHHPKLISERGNKNKITISGKTGMPKDIFGKGLTVGALKQLDMANDDEERNHETATLVSRVSELSIRNKHETLGEKRERKLAFREYKKERREEKKANQMAFKEEKGLQERNTLNNKRNIQGQKIV